MRTMSLSTWLRKLAPARGRRSGKQAEARAKRYRPAVEKLEDRLTPASSITIIPGAAGSGSLDGFLSPTDGTITTADGGGVPGTLSTGALVSVNPTTDISIAALASIVV